MPKLTVYIPDELQARLAKVFPYINLSAAARRGIEQELTELEATLGPATIKALGVAWEKRR
jgi:post-segregation antitoxin (ccd killing protein)